MLSKPAHFVRDSYKGKPISRQRLSHWVVEAILLCYNNTNLEPPIGLQAHLTSGMASSCVLFKGISIQEMFYSLDVTEPSLAHSVLGVSSQGILCSLLSGQIPLFILLHLCRVLYSNNSLLFLQSASSAYRKYGSGLYPIVRYRTNIKKRTVGY